MPVHPSTVELLSLGQNTGGTVVGFFLDVTCCDCDLLKNIVTSTQAPSQTVRRGKQHPGTAFLAHQKGGELSVNGN